jgi:hypothetical protein
VADKGYGWVHASPAKVADPVIGQLIDKLTVDPNPPPYPDRFPHHHGATVTIALRDGPSSRATSISADPGLQACRPTWT